MVALSHARQGVYLHASQGGRVLYATLLVVDGLVTVEETAPACS